MVSAGGFTGVLAPESADAPRIPRNSKDPVPKGDCKSTTGQGTIRVLPTYSDNSTIRITMRALQVTKVAVELGAGRSRFTSLSPRLDQKDPTASRQRFGTLGSALTGQSPALGAALGSCTAAGEGSAPAARNFS